MWCLYVSVHELCAACAIHRPLPLCFCTNRCFLPCLLSFFYSNFFASLSSFIHWSFSPRLDCVSNLRLYLSYLCFSFLVHLASLHSFDRFHPCEVGLLRGVIDGWFVMMGMYPLHLHLLICSHHDAASVVAMHWVRWCRKLSRLLSFANAFIIHSTDAMRWIGWRSATVDCLTYKQLNTNFFSFSYLISDVMCYCFRVNGTLHCPLLSMSLDSIPQSSNPVSLPFTQCRLPITQIASFH
jgi:hypothetical protein